MRKTLRHPESSDGVMGGDNASVPNEFHLLHSGGLVCDGCFGRPALSVGAQEVATARRLAYGSGDNVKQREPLRVVRKRAGPADDVQAALRLSWLRTSFRAESRSSLLNELRPILSTHQSFSRFSALKRTALTGRAPVRALGMSSPVGANLMRLDVTFRECRSEDLNRRFSGTLADTPPIAGWRSVHPCSIRRFGRSQSTKSRRHF